MNSVNDGALNSPERGGNGVGSVDDTTPAVTALQPALASHGEDAAKASASVALQARRGGHSLSAESCTLSAENKVQLAADIEYETSRRLPAGDPGAQTLVGRNVSASKLVAANRALAATSDSEPGCARALALAEELDAQLNGVSVDKELMVAAIHAHTRGAAPQLYGHPATDNAINSQHQTDADALPPVTGPSGNAPASKRTPRRLLALGALVGIAALLWVTKSLVTPASTAPQNATAPPVNASALAKAALTSAAPIDGPKSVPASAAHRPVASADAAISSAPITASMTPLPPPPVAPASNAPPPARPVVAAPAPRRRGAQPSTSQSPFIIHQATQP